MRRKQAGKMLAWMLAAAMMVTLTPAMPATAAEPDQMESQMPEGTGQSETETEKIEPKVITSITKPKLDKSTFAVGTKVADMKLPKTLSAVGYDKDGDASAAAELKITGVTWSSKYKADSEADTYTFTAVLPKAYELAKDVVLPKLTITISADAEPQAETTTETESETESETETETETETESETTVETETETETESETTVETESETPEPIVNVPKTEQEPGPAAEPQSDEGTGTPKAPVETLDANLIIESVKVTDGKAVISEADSTIKIYLQNADTELKKVILELEKTTPDFTNAEAKMTIEPSNDTLKAGIDLSNPINLELSQELVTDEIHYHTYSVSAEICTKHEFGDWTIDKQPTCAEKGSQSHTCELCGLTVSEEIPMTEHSWSEWKTTKAATCTEKGSEERTCSVCKEVQTREIAALGHKWNSSWTIDVEATCTEAGSKSHHCDVCDEVKDVTEIKALGHKWSDWTITREATHTKKGEKQRECSRCGEIEVKSIPKVNIIGKAKNNAIGGISTTTTYATGTNITFTAAGDGMDNDKPIEGDVRFVPDSWDCSSANGGWSKAPYTKTIQFSSAGTYTLNVNFERQEYIDGEWVQNGDDDIKSISIKVTGKTITGTTTTNGTKAAAKTGDTSPIIWLIAAMVVAAGAIFLLFRKKKS